MLALARTAYFPFPAILVATVVFLLVLGFLMAWRRHAKISAAVSLTTWLGLAMLTTCIATLLLPDRL